MTKLSTFGVEGEGGRLQVKNEEINTTSGVFLFLCTIISLLNIQHLRSEL